MPSMENLGGDGASAAAGLDPATAAMAQAGSSGLNTVANMYMANAANRSNKRSFDAQANFAKFMSDTAHQREVQDLQAAGLNPILSAGGNGASTPTPSPQGAVMPHIELPDFMAYGISLKQLEQADQRIAIEKANSAAGIAKTLSDTDLVKMKQILAQKGMVRAELEGDAYSVLQKAKKFLIDSATKQKSPPTQQQP